jgi:hypothetical protein
MSTLKKPDLSDPKLRAKLAKGMGHNYYGEPAWPNDLSIGKHAPIPRYIVRKVPNKKTDIAIGLLNGFENLLTFSIKGRIIKPSGINV